MKKSKKLLACMLAAVNICAVGSNFTALSVSAESEKCCCELPPIPQEELEKIEAHSQEKVMPANIQIKSAQALPSSVDLSTSPYFPPIGDQGEMGSCVAWATTYYQFTFAANKLNNITSTKSTAYSPSWIYNWLNNGIANSYSGVERYSVYNMLSTRGCLTMADCPYYKADGTYNTSIKNDTKKMIDALETKLSSYETICIRTSETPITSPKDSDLNQLKTLLNNGYILQVNMRYNFTTKRTTNNEEAVCACYKTTLGHGLTIVGYNDNIQCDINGDGKISEGEKGAFKIADSHGTSEHNNGFFWLMYDALNNTSNYSNNTDRVAAFSFGVPQTNVNFFCYIEVKKSPVNVVALLDINTNCINNFDFSTTKSYVNPYNDNNTESYLAHKGSMPPSEDIMAGILTFNGTIPLDYGNLDNPVSVFTDNNTCFLGVYMKKRRDDAYTAPTISKIKLCDNNMNTITSTTSIPNVENGSWFKSLSAHLIVGDLNYNKIIDSGDADILLNFIAKRTSLSNLQRHLADINKDGIISLTDLTALNKKLPTNEKLTFLRSAQEIYNNMSLEEQAEYSTMFRELECSIIADMSASVE